jgi:hypothetical protein
LLALELVQLQTQLHFVFALNFFPSTLAAPAVPWPVAAVTVTAVPVAVAVTGFAVIPVIG